MILSKDHHSLDQFRTEAVAATGLNYMIPATHKWEQVPVAQRHRDMLWSEGKVFDVGISKMCQPGQLDKLTGEKPG